MAKSKEKKSTLRFAQQDYDFCSSYPFSSNAQRTLRRSVSSRGQYFSSPSRFTSPPSTLPRTVITLADVVNSNREARVRVKHRKRAIQRTPPTTSPPSSSKPCAHPLASPVSIKPRCGPSVETGSLGSRSGTDNPRIGIVPSPSPIAQGQATSGNVGPSPSQHHTGLLLMLDVACCYDGWGLLIGLFLRCFAAGDYSSSYFALFWEACSLLGALFGSVAVDAGLVG